MFARRQKKSVIKASRPNVAPAQVLTLPAPVGGLNARDSIAAMPATDAVILDNFFPTATSVDLRSGFRKWSTGYPADVESLMPYNSATLSKLFAASGTAFYDATASGAVGAAVVNGLANARWQTSNMSTPGGQFLYCVNGADSPQIYTGAVWQRVAGVGAQTINNITHVGTTATVTTNAAHGLETGNYITESGATPAAYNGTYRITVVTPIAAVPISSITRVGTAATLITSAPHGLPTGPGNLVTISGASPAQYNGTYQVTVPTPAASVAIASITRVGTTATLTTSVAHGIPLGAGTSITVSGATPAQYNGTYNVNVTSTTTLTYVMASDPGASAAPVGTYVVNPYLSTFTYTMASDPGASASPVGSYVVEANKFTYVMATDPGVNASVVGSYIVAPAITGVDPKKLIHVNLYANRMFFVEKESTRAWYLPVNSIGGAALSFDFGSLMSLGGYLMAMATWTIDNSAGSQEYAIFITSEGEVFMYAGTDPSNAANWTRAGRYRIGRPVGRRCYERIDSDVILLTADGFVPMSKVILTDRKQNEAISDKISTLVSADLSSYFNNFGWQGCLHTFGDKFIVNVPSVEGMRQYQYVMNRITGAWSRFTGWNANTFATLGNNLYFGSNLGKTANTAYVALADDGPSDDGGYIFGEAKPAFQYFGAPGRQKQITMAKPLLQTSGNLQVALGIDMDFSDNFPTATPTFNGATGTPWNTTPWNTVPWGSPELVKQDWQGVTGVGDAAALHMRVVNNKSTLKWLAVEYVYRMGGVL